MTDGHAPGRVPRGHRAQRRRLVRGVQGPARAQALPSAGRARAGVVTPLRRNERARRRGPCRRGGRRCLLGGGEGGRFPQPAGIAAALGRTPEEIRDALKRLAAGKVLILAPNDGNIWAANPFCAVPSGFRVSAGGKTYWGICIWDSSVLPPRSGRMPSSTRRAATAASRCGSKSAGRGSSEARESFTSPFPRTGGGTTSDSRDRRCFSSGTKSTWIGGAGRGIFRGRPPDAGPDGAARPRLVRPKLARDWRRHTLEETEALLAEVGLTGPFWNLRRT